MAIIVPHLFFDRLADTSEYNGIKTLIIGSFNPGMPLLSALSDKEKTEYEKLKAEGKLEKQKRLLNFYNRTNNRFWGVLDRLYFERSDEIRSQKENRVPGLKHYSSVEVEELTYQRQKKFCLQQQIFITDIVKSLSCDSFEGIYNSFTDVVLDKYVYEWNTDKILEIINLHQPVKVLFTFKPSMSIPNISKQIEKIRGRHTQIHFLLSPSGNALNSYEKLVSSWKEQFFF